MWFKENFVAQIFGVVVLIVFVYVFVHSFICLFCLFFRRVFVCLVAFVLFSFFIVERANG